jgi:hypothetical protein
MTLIGAAGAGLLLWLASQTDADSLGGYWTFLGLIAAAGLTLSLSQLLGGWTKWGWPRISASVLVLGLLPALVVGGLVLLHAQPDSSAWGTGWAGDLGATGLAEDLTSVVPAIALGLGALFGFTFDTTGPRVRREVVDEAEKVRRPGYLGPVPVEQTADEPLTADRTIAAQPVRTPVDRDRDGVDDREEAYVGARATTATDDEHVVRSDDGATVEPEPGSRRRRFFGRD